MKSKPTREHCQICGALRSRRELLPADAVREAVGETIRKMQGTWDGAGFICFEDLNRFRALHVQQVMTAERGELSDVERHVLETIREHETVAEDVNRRFSSSLTFGERIADHVARFGGSWTFILSFLLALGAWMLLNSRVVTTAPTDPYPFIFLNLILSCVAALQAPVIMMSQRRQEAKDRTTTEHDYKVNLKAELEIRNLTSKMDLLISHQWQHLLEIQQIQTDMMDEVLKAMKRAP